MIQEWIKSNGKRCENHTIFENKDLPQPIVAVMFVDVCQIDLAII